MIQKLNWEKRSNGRSNTCHAPKIISGEKLMIARMKFKDGFLVPQHHHMHEQVTQVLSGQIRFGLAKQRTGNGFVCRRHSSNSRNLPHEALMIGDVEEIDTWAPRARIGLIKQTITQRK